MVILDYKLFQLHLEKYFRERLNEYKILIKQKALNDEVYDQQLFDKLVHDFKETTAIKNDVLFRCKQEITHAYILIEGEVEIYAVIKDQTSDHVQDLLQAFSTLKANNNDWNDDCNRDINAVQIDQIQKK